ncbi:macrolide transporter ATP-binding /permease protein [Serratia fonticola]|uniref:Macrolide transporter ATP-binding /permease protein n=1 Tax=Serratia fonticola TaxID=47917 RepID=A0A4U9W1S6_SERFO|nr:macrolide transporter ATP-binding /permease protein [Serratia fonticola]
MAALLELSNIRRSYQSGDQTLEVLKSVQPADRCR